MFGVRRHRMLLTEGGGGSCVVRCARRQATESMRVQVSVVVLTVTMRAAVVVVVTAVVVVVVVVVLGDGLRRSTRQRNVGGHGVAGAEGNNTHRPTKDVESGVGRARGSEVVVQLPLDESEANRVRRVTSHAVSGAETKGTLAVRRRPCHLPIQQACRLR